MVSLLNSTSNRISQSLNAEKEVHRRITVPGTLNFESVEIAVPRMKGRTNEEKWGKALKIVNKLLSDNNGSVERTVRSEEFGIRAMITRQTGCKPMRCITAV